MSASPDRLQYFSQTALGLLCPMHVQVCADGIIRGLGPTLEKLTGKQIIGRALFDVFTIQKPRRVTDTQALRGHKGKKLSLKSTGLDGEAIHFRGVLTFSGRESDGVFLDLALGTDLAEVMQRFELTSADFKANDVSIDLFYTYATQRTLLEDSQRLAGALSSAKEEAERKAHMDSLTGIPNRRAMNQRLYALLRGEQDGDASAEPAERIGRVGDPCAFLHIDLDKFKFVNDTFGHAAGDAILQHTANVLLCHCRDTDMPVRIGGDEFAMIVEDAADMESVQRRAEAVIADICRPVRVQNNSCIVGASIGIVQFQIGAGTTSDRLQIHSDIALYEAKKTGKAAIVLTPEMIERHESNVALVADIRDGLAAEQFVPFFQPQINAREGRVVGLEVVARWARSEDHVVSPGIFLEAAVSSNLMSDIDTQVRRRAFEVFAEWIQQGRNVGQLSLNVSASNLCSPDFIETMQDELFSSGLSPAMIKLELLESILFDHSDMFLIQQCHALRDAGFTLALDDFGTGHSSIATLIDAPISVLKIDRSFVSGLDSNSHKKRITSSMIAMADQLSLDVLAEGVETLAELDVLLAAGCDVIQGFLFAKPLSAQDLETWLQTWEMPARCAAG